MDGTHARRGSSVVERACNCGYYARGREEMRVQGPVLTIWKDSEHVDEEDTVKLFLEDSSVGSKSSSWTHLTLAVTTCMLSGTVYLTLFP
jgi:hypothetical protein